MNRNRIYYWKSDRPSAFESLKGHQSVETTQNLVSLLHRELKENFHVAVGNILPAGGQGNHATFTAEWKDKKLFVRLEDGPEQDNYMLVEAKVIEMVGALGVPTVKLYKTDASRKNVSFAYQVMDFLQGSDLNSLYKSKQIDLVKFAVDIGKYIACWQSIAPKGFGPFSTEAIVNNNELKGLHRNYADYYYLNLEQHLNFLVQRNFITADEAIHIRLVIDTHKSFLQLSLGCLVHKDMALWNIMGSGQTISAFIDWDDTISGDPTDDLSLLACFHDAPVITAAIQGYKSVRELPDNFEIRFYLHLLRNMLVKAVIRVGGDYFSKADDFFLIDTGEKGSSLEQVTRDKIFDALDKFRHNKFQPVFI